MKEVTGNREHKDRLFISIFQNKEDLLSLYNAVNDSSYEEAYSIFPGYMPDMWRPMG